MEFVNGSELKVHPAEAEDRETPSEVEAAQKAYDLGYEYERKYGACSQCTILAIMDALGERNSDVFKTAFGFAGGIGSLSKTCGALAAGVMAIGLEHGRELENLTRQTEKEKRECLQMVRDLHARFMEEYGRHRMRGCTPEALWQNLQPMG